MALMTQIFVISYQLVFNFINDILIIFAVMYSFEVWIADIQKVDEIICCNSFLNPHLNFDSSLLTIYAEQHGFSVSPSFCHFDISPVSLSVLFWFLLSLSVCLLFPVFYRSVFLSCSMFISVLYWAAVDWTGLWS